MINPNYLYRLNIQAIRHLVGKTKGVLNIKRKTEIINNTVKNKNGVSN